MPDLSEIQFILNAAAHDLKSPLRRILFYCDALQDSASNRLEPDENDMLLRIVANSARLQNLIENLITLARLYTNPPQKIQTDISSLVSQTLQEVPPLSDETRSYEIATLPPINIYPLELKTLLINLLKNAQLYRSPTRPLQTSLILKSHDQNVYISLTDNGIGIANEYLNEITEPFKRLHTQDDIEGSGLGLAICKKIAEIHGGELQITSTPEQGSNFTLKFPKNTD